MPYIDKVRNDLKLGAESGEFNVTIKCIEDFHKVRPLVLQKIELEWKIHRIYFLLLFKQHKEAEPVVSV